MTAETTAPAAERGSRFHFKSKGLEVEFEGRDDFLTGQIEHLRPAFERELKRLADAAPPAAVSAATSAPAASIAGAAPSAPGGTPSLEEFYRRARSREGRGALQET